MRPVPVFIALPPRFSGAVPSRAVLEVFLNPPERRQRPRQAEVVLTERQRMILQGLVADLKRTEIARTAYCSTRTVDREITLLQERLGAASEFTLGVRAGAVGVRVLACAWRGEISV